jgi:hypothetical protein
MGPRVIAGWTLLGDFDCRKVAAGRFGVEADVVYLLDGFREL